MKYRNIFLEFLYDYREYQYNCIQLVVLEKKNRDDLMNFFHQTEEIEIYQIKGSQVFYKKRLFSDIKNTIVESAFVNDQPQSMEFITLSNMKDIFNDNTMSKTESKYLYVKPVISDNSLIAVFIVYSNYNVEWMISNKRIIRLIDDLQKSMHLDTYDEVCKKANSKYWILENTKIYLSNDLKKLTNTTGIINSIELKGLYLEKIDEIVFNNAILSIYQKNDIPTIESLFELYNLSVEQYTLLYIESTDSEVFEDFCVRILDVIRNIDGQLGKTHLYQVDNNHLIVLFNKVYHQNLIASYFGTTDYILVRSGNELRKKVDFKMLVEYLNLSPIEAFSQSYYNYFCDNYNKEKVKKVINNLSQSKIRITPIFDSLKSEKQGYLIKDIANIDLFDRTTKQKSILSLFRIADEYKTNVLYIELPLKYFFENDKLILSILNKVKKFYQENTNYYLITNYNEKISKLYLHWPDLNKYLYFYDIPGDLYSTILSKKNVNGIYFSSEEYRKFFTKNNIIACDFLKFTLNNSKNILVSVKKTDIIKYQQENLLLVCE